jgi:hypothetical protein
MRSPLLALALLTAAPLAAQNGCLDQSYLPVPVNNGLEITASQTLTQTFTVGIGGVLTGVEVANLNHHRGTPTQPLELRIVATDASGTPNGATLAALSFLPSQVPAGRGTLSVDLRAFAIPVVPGMVLGLRLSSLVTPGTQTYAWWGEAAGTIHYAAGMVFLRDTTPLAVWDLSFQSFVGPSAASRNYGAGHPGAGGVPSLLASAPPVLGTAIDLLAGNSSGNGGSAALLAGFAPANVATPFGGTLLVQIDASFTIPLPAAGATVPLAIPASNTLCGLRVFFQTVQLDFAASHGLAFSPGLELLLGG